MVAVEDNDLLHSDEALAARIRAGDRGAENELVRHYSGRTFAMMLVRTRDRETARELTDDVLMATVTALRRGGVKDTSRLGAFIHGIAVNVANGHLRALRRQPRTEAMDPNLQHADTAMDGRRQDDLIAARRCIERLPVQDQSILMLTLVRGLKPGEIAPRLGMSAEAVRQRKSRALQAIREMLEPSSRIPTPGPLKSE